MAEKGGRPGRWERALLWYVVVAAWEVAWGQLRYSVPEELPKGSFVGDVAKDLGLDMPVLRARGARVFDTGRTQYFVFDLQNGHLSMKERVDREEICAAVAKCVLNFELLLKNPMNLYRGEVEILDINDNSPSFSERNSVLEISEYTAPGTRFPLEKAQDPDIGVNSLQNYECSESTYFTLDVKNGDDGMKYPELILVKSLDRELQAAHTLILTAIDSGTPVRSGSTTIQIIVLDGNDNAPEFTQPIYKVTVREDAPVGSRVLQVTATDRDEGPNAQVKYSFFKIPEKFDKTFKLDPESGEIEITEKLNFEEPKFYELDVQARDAGGLSTHSKVIITVADVNNHIPEIVIMSVFSPVPEDTPLGTVIAIFNVQDRDSGANGDVRCSIAESLPFRLEKTFEDYYRVVTAQELDREEVSAYNVTVRASDSGSPPLWSSAVLALRVLDVNDNAPVFAEARYSARVPENNAAGALVLTVRASDADWGQNARVRYRLWEGRVRGAALSSYVSVQAETGVSLTADSRKSQLRFSGGSCCDTLPARPPADSSGDLVPTGDQVAENDGQVSFQLPARKLRIVSGDEKQYFTLGEDNTNLRVNQRIDREEICGAVSPCVLSLEAVVENPFNIFHVSVTIQDINDNAPQFDREFVAIEMIESTPPGARFPLGSGRDPDTGVNSLQNYQLNPNPLFSLVVRESPDGTKHAELVLEKSLDREKQRNHHLVLTAVDGGDPVRSGTAQIKINVTDANDNSPVFTKEIYKVRLLENLPEGSLAFQVKATDGDEGINAEITYSFSDIPNRARQLFSLDSKTGDVKITGPLDYEERKYYEASVEGKDGGGLTAHAKVHIDIIDVNDNAPTLSLLPILNPIPEDSVQSTVVAVINVRDRDSGDNGEVSCNIDGHLPFRLEPSSGNTYKLILASALDREKVSAYNITITARDRGSPALWSRAALVLEVSDVNDNAPVFEEAAYSAYVAENNAAGAEVVRVRARDADAGANGRVSYWLVSLTADSRKSQLRFSGGSCCDTLPARPPPDEPAPLLGEDPAAARRAEPDPDPDAPP
ncbi:PREDICTED: protocadherin gamma-A7-like, partial [Charadrius vociferus]|uniref:protocadherin gamma-A7-like n=1 Tax=Charadrius vociferus TaxID=50402 RepID=UPI00052158BC